MVTIGCDIERINRFKGVLKNRRFLSHIFNDEELKYCFARKRPEIYLAQKFACKEAAFKALSSFGQNIPLKFIKISNKNRRCNLVQIPYRGIEKRYKISVSTSYTKEVVLASSIAERLQE